MFLQLCLKFLFVPKLSVSMHPNVVCSFFFETSSQKWGCFCNFLSLLGVFLKIDDHKLVNQTTIFHIYPSLTIVKVLKMAIQIARLVSKPILLYCCIHRLLRAAWINLKCIKYLTRMIIIMKQKSKMRNLRRKMHY